MRIVLLVGLPGAGKSTWLDRRGTTISSDQIREFLTGDITNQSVNARVFEIVRYLLRQRLEVGAAETYVDATSLTREERWPYVELSREFHAEIDAVYFDVPVEICKQRNLARARVVPADAMERLAAKLQPPSEAEGFSRIIVVSNQTPARASAGGAQPDL